MERNLIDYLPPFLQEYEEMRQIMTAEQPEFELTWEMLELVLSNQFVPTATEVGLSRMEKILKIQPKPTDTFEERRFQIIMKMNAQAIYTMNSLKKTLNQMLGADGYSIELDSNKYSLSIRLALGNKRMYEVVSDYLRETVPANMLLAIKIMYNTNDILKTMTHKKMQGMTHTQLKEEVV